MNFSDYIIIVLIIILLIVILINISHLNNNKHININENFFGWGSFHKIKSFGKKALKTISKVNPVVNVATNLSKSKGLSKIGNSIADRSIEAAKYASKVNPVVNVATNLSKSKGLSKIGNSIADRSIEAAKYASKKIPSMNAKSILATSPLSPAIGMGMGIDASNMKHWISRQMLKNKASPNEKPDNDILNMIKKYKSKGGELFKDSINDVCKSVAHVASDAAYSKCNKLCMGSWDRNHTLQPCRDINENFIDFSSLSGVNMKKWIKNNYNKGKDTLDSTKDTIKDKVDSTKDTIIDKIDSTKDQLVMNAKEYICPKVCKLIKNKTYQCVLGMCGDINDDSSVNASPQICRKYCGLPNSCPPDQSCMSAKSNYKNLCPQGCGLCKCVPN